MKNKLSCFFATMIGKGAFFLSLVAIGLVLFMLSTPSCKKDFNNSLTQQVSNEGHHLMKSGEIMKPEEQEGYEEDEHDTVKTEIHDTNTVFLDSLHNEVKRLVERVVTPSTHTRVGVLKHNDCLSYDQIQIKLDEEDHESNSKVEGNWVGASSVSGGDVYLNYCIVEGSLFHPGPFEYGLFLIDPYLPIDMNTNTVTAYKKVSVYHDNEDGWGVDNWALWTPYVGTQYKTPYNEPYSDATTGPNRNNKNTSLAYIIYPESSTASSFPNLGMSYGVFGQGTNDGRNGSIYCDDEDWHNTDEFDVYLISTNACTYESEIPNVMKSNNGNNTKYFLTRVN